jgi:hypothetical protein
MGQTTTHQGASIIGDGSIHGSGVTHWWINWALPHGSSQGNKKPRLAPGLLEDKW